MKNIGQRTHFSTEDSKRSRNGLKIKEFSGQYSGEIRVTRIFFCSSYQGESYVAHLFFYLG